MAPAKFLTRLIVEFDVYPGATEVVLRMPDGTERSLGRIVADNDHVQSIEGWHFRGGTGLRIKEPDGSSIGIGDA